jgi:hypothetical protein
LQKDHVQCNQCWHDAQRSCDLRMLSITKTFVPTRLMKWLLPRYDWKEIYRHAD